MLEENLLKLLVNDQKFTPLLDFSNQPLSSKDAVNLFAALRYNLVVTEANFSGTGLIPESFDTLPATLRTNSTLQKLNLSNNNLMFTEFIQRVFFALRNNKSLLELDLSNNQIGINCKTELLTLLKANKQIKINLKGNPIISDLQIAEILNQRDQHQQFRKIGKDNQEDVLDRPQGKNPDETKQNNTATYTLENFTQVIEFSSKDLYTLHKEYLQHQFNQEQDEFLKQENGYPKPQLKEPKYYFYDDSPVPLSTVIHTAIENMDQIAEDAWRSLKDEEGKRLSTVLKDASARSIPFQFMFRQKINEHNITPELKVFLLGLAQNDVPTAPTPANEAACVIPKMFLEHRCLPKIEGANISSSRNSSVDDFYQVSISEFSEGYSVNKNVSQKIPAYIIDAQYKIRYFPKEKNFVLTQGCFKVYLNHVLLDKGMLVFFDAANHPDYFEKLTEKELIHGVKNLLEYEETDRKEKISPLVKSYNRKKALSLAIQNLYERFIKPSENRSNTLNQFIQLSLRGEFLNLAFKSIVDKTFYELLTIEAMKKQLEITAEFNSEEEKLPHHLQYPFRTLAQSLAVKSLYDRFIKSSENPRKHLNKFIQLMPKGEFLNLAFKSIIDKSFYELFSIKELKNQLDINYRLNLKEEKLPFHLQYPFRVVAQEIATQVLISRILHNYSENIKESKYIKYISNFFVLFFSAANELRFFKPLSIDNIMQGLEVASQLDDKEKDFPKSFKSKHRPTSIIFAVKRLAELLRHSDYKKYYELYRKLPAAYQNVFFANCSDDIKSVIKSTPNEVGNRIAVTDKTNQWINSLQSTITNTTNKKHYYAEIIVANNIIVGNLSLEVMTQIMQIEYLQKNTMAEIQVSISNLKFNFLFNLESSALELSVRNLYLRIAGEGVPLTAIMKLTIGSKVYVGLISQRLSNKDKKLNSVLGAELLKYLDTKNLSAHALMTLILLPKNANTDKYLIETASKENGEDESPHIIESINNCDYFGSIQPKTIIFGLINPRNSEQRVLNLPLSEYLVTEFLTLQPYPTLLAWCDEIINLNNLIKQLFPNNPEYQIKLPSGSIIGLYQRFCKLQKLFSAFPQMPLIEVLTHLEGEETAKIYQSATENYLDINDFYDYLSFSTPVEENPIFIEPEELRKELNFVFNFPRTLNLLNDKEFDVNILINSIEDDAHLEKFISEIDFSLIPKEIQQQLLQEITTEKSLSQKFIEMHGKIFKTADCTESSNSLREFLDKLYKLISHSDFKAIKPQQQHTILTSLVKQMEINFNEDKFCIPGIEEWEQPSQQFRQLYAETCKVIGKNIFLLPYCTAIHYILTSDEFKRLSFKDRKDLLYSIFVTYNKLDLTEISIPRKFESLELSNAEFLDDEVLRDILKHSHATLRKLKLVNCNRITHRQFVLELQSLVLDSLTVQNCKHLKVFQTYSYQQILEWSRIDRDFTYIVLGQLADNKLNITNINLDTMQIEIIKTVLADLPIEHLSLLNCGLTDGKLSNISEIIPCASHLTTLNLSQNEITAKGLAGLLYKISAQNKITTLDLSNTSITDGGLKLLFDNIAYCPSLQHINLSNNAISKEGLRSILELLKNNTNILYINLDGEADEYFLLQNNQNNYFLFEINKQIKFNKLLHSFHDAIREENLESAKQLAKEFHKDTKSFTALFQKGTGTDGNIALHHAAVVGNRGIALFIIETMCTLGLNLEIENKNGKTAIDLAKSEEFGDYLKKQFEIKYGNGKLFTLNANSSLFGQASASASASVSASSSSSSSSSAPSTPVKKRDNHNIGQFSHSAPSTPTKADHNADNNFDL